MRISQVDAGSKSFILSSILFIIVSLIAFISDLPILISIPFFVLGFSFFLQDVRFAFYALLFFIPISFQYLDKFDFPDEPLMLLNTLFFFLFYLFNYKKIELNNLLKNPIFFTILLSFAWLIITVLFSKDVLLSSKFLLKKIWYLVPFLLFPIFLFGDKKIIIRSYQFLFFSLFIVVWIVVIRFSAVGFRFEEVHDPVTPFFQNHVMYGSMVSVVLPYIFVAFLLSRKLSIQWLISILGILLFLFATYFSYSRAAWVAVIFAGICFVAVRLRIMQYVIIGFYVLVISLVSWLSNKNTYLTYKPKFEKTIMHESLEDHIVATIQGTDISSAERYYRWIAALRMSKDNPIFGVGPNNFYDYYKAYTISSFKTWVSRNPERSTTHNYFLFMLVEQGVPGMLLYATLIFIIFYYGQKVYHKQKEPFYQYIIMGALCSIAAVFINNFFSELLESDKIGSIFHLSIAVIIAVDLQKNKNYIKK